MIAAVAVPASANAAAAPRRAVARPLGWVDAMKAVALAWIVLDHVVERLFGYPWIGNPARGWPPLAERVAQLAPLHGHGVWDLPLSLLRWVGWTGDQGVSLFLLLSGFGLTWGLLARGVDGTLPMATFVRRRAARIFPLWWGAHLLVGVPALATGRIGLDDPDLWLSLIGVRATRDGLYLLAPAWWYVPCLLQCYLAFPLLWEGLRRRGPAWLLAVTCAVALPVRLAGLLWFDGYLDAWSRGAIALTRLPEFAAGVALAAWLHDRPEAAARLRAPATRAAALGVWVVAMLLSLTLAGMAVAPLLLGLSAFVLLWAPLARARGTGAAGWIGRHSYALFLVHHPAVIACVPKDPWSAGATRTIAGVVAAILLTLGLALALERAVDGAPAAVRHCWRRRRRVAAAVVVAGALALGAEGVVRALAPQEVFGWGERPALEPEARLGWRLRPSTETRLRWESYDYRVHANALGFPGPEPAARREPGGLRIVTLGDAFTSAEGVDTDAAWPRLLERLLATRLAGRPVEVVNVAITGWGPNQYAAAATTLLPVLRPELLVVGLYVNDFEDVLQRDDDVRAAIGFGRPDPDGLGSWLALAHLRRWVALALLEPLRERATGRPGAHGTVLGGFKALRTDRPDLDGPGRAGVETRLGEIAARAAAAGTTVAIALFPAPVQVCGPDALAYWPRPLDLSDRTRFDVERPQRMAVEIAATLGLPVHDLRGALRAAARCPFQPRNLHWTEAGHRVVADDVARWLLDAGLTGPPGSGR